MKILAVLLALAIFGLQWPLWAGKGGVSAVKKMETEFDEQKARKDGMLARNVALENEVKDLKSGLQSVEEYARSELGMVKQGEIFFQIVSESPTKIVPPRTDVPAKK